jgi:branched-chain amino acid transport system permease protein
LRRGSVLVAIVGLVVVGLVAGSYTDFEIAGAFCVWLAVQGVVVLTGLTGIITIGQGAFYAIGAYSCLLLVEHTGMPYVLAVTCAALISLVAGAIVALPASRVHGAHLGIVTIALAVVVPQVIDEFTSFTGGENGISIGGLLASPVHGISSGEWEYFLALVVACLGAFAILALRRSPYGRRLAAIKRSESLAVAVGSNTYLDVVVAFCLAGFYGGLGGAVMAIFEGSISPDAFTFELSASFLLAAIIGGSSSPFGALAGALVVSLVPQLSATMPQEIPEFLYAGIPLLMIYAARAARASSQGGGDRLRRRAGRWLRRAQSSITGNQPLGHPLGHALGSQLPVSDEESMSATQLADG